MKILLSGGGSGGHVTPLKYIAREIKKVHPDSEVFYVGPRIDVFASIITKDEQNIDDSFQLYSGKWRRYSDENILQKILDVKTNVLNLRDIFFVCVGFVQAIFLLKKMKPDVILLKGGFVGVPVGMAARLLNVPFVTHDSDTIAGLANRIVGRWAKVNAVGQSKGVYPYDTQKMKTVGVPINPAYKEARGQSDKSAYKKQLGLKPDQPLVFSMGGSLGADVINQAVAAAIPLLKKRFVQLIHIAGRGKSDELRKLEQSDDSMIRILDFEDDEYKMLAYYLAADVVVSRAGTTSIAELSALACASIIIPAKQLSDQVANAQQLKQQEAAHVLFEQDVASDPTLLATSIERLLDDNDYAARLSIHLHKFTAHDATENITAIITEVQQG